MAGHDFILALGAPVFTYHVEGFGPHLPDGAELVQLIDNPDMAAWTPDGMSIVTSLKHGVRDLLAAPEPCLRAPPKPRKPAPRLSGKPLTDRYLLQQVAALRPEGAVIVEEAPSSRGPMHDYLPITDKDGFYTCASGGLGHGLPAAIGVALGRPNEKIIAILGDGSSMYSIQGLWTAARLGLAVSFVIINNERYEALHEFGRLFELDVLPGAELPAIDFCGVAEGLGISAVRIDRAEELDEALVRSFSATAPTLVEVKVDVAHKT